MKLLLVVASVIQLVCHCQADCVFKLGKNALHYPLILEKIGLRYRFLPIKQNGLTVLKNGQQVIVTCQSQSLAFCTGKFGSVQLLCKDSHAYIAFNDKTVPYYPKKYKLGCKAPVIQHYLYPVQGCKKTGVLAAFVNHIKTSNPNYNLVKIVEYCYDLHLRKVLFAHYKSYYSPYLDLQYRQNVGEKLTYDNKILKKKVSSIDFYNFGPNPLKPSNVFVVGNSASSPLIGFPYALTISQSRLNQFLTWKVLQQKNWANYLKILLNFTRRYIVEDYAGTTDGPKGVSPNALVPSYQWSHAKVFSTKTYKQVVVVGVNVPNLNQRTVQPYVFCHDICNQVPWLRSLGRQRTQASSGYVFCCSLDEASTLIPEFPRNLVTRPTTTSITKRRTASGSSRRATPRRTTFEPFPYRKVVPKSPKFRKCDKYDGVGVSKLHPEPNILNVTKQFERHSKSGRNNSIINGSTDFGKHKNDTDHHSRGPKDEKPRSVEIKRIINWLSSSNFKHYGRQQRSARDCKDSESDSLDDWEDWNGNGSHLTRGYYSHRSIDQGKNPFSDLKDADDISS